MEYLLNKESSQMVLGHSFAPASARPSWLPSSPPHACSHAPPTRRSDIRLTQMNTPIPSAVGRILCVFGSWSIRLRVFAGFSLKNSQPRDGILQRNTITRNPIRDMISRAGVSSSMKMTVIEKVTRIMAIANHFARTGIDFSSRH